MTSDASSYSVTGTPGVFRDFRQNTTSWLLVNGSGYTDHLNGVGSLAAAITEGLHFAHKIIARQRQQGVVYA